MAIASVVAIVAMSYLAIDAGIVSTGVVTKRIEFAKASIADAAASQHQIAFAVQALTRRSQQKPHVEECMAID